MKGTGLMRVGPWRWGRGRRRFPQVGVILLAPLYVGEVVVRLADTLEGLDLIQGGRPFKDAVGAGIRVE